MIKKNRWIYKELKKEINNERIVHLCGQRRTGKTTLFQELNRDTPNSEYIFIKENQDIYDIMDYINNSQNQIFFLDEITNIKNIELLNYLYDECIRVHNKKIFITSTNSLEIYLMRNSILADRVYTIPIYPLGLPEYVDVILDKESYNRKDYIEFINCGGFFTEFDGKQQIDFIINSFYRSITKVNDNIMDKEELRLSILNIMIKLVWDNSFIPDRIEKLVDNRKINSIQQKIIEKEFNISKDTQLIYYNFSKTVEYLLNMGIIKFIPDISGMNGKFILLNIPIQIYLYREITNELNKNRIETSQFNISFWGKIFENIMITSNSIQTNYKQFCYDRGIHGEVDDILRENNNLYLLEYKSNPNFQINGHENFIFANKEEENKIREIVEIQNIYKLYVYPGITQKEKNLFNNLEINRLVNTSKLHTILNDNTSQEIATNKGMFWE